MTTNEALNVNIDGETQIGPETVQSTMCLHLRADGLLFLCLNRDAQTHIGESSRVWETWPVWTTPSLRRCWNCVEWRALRAWGRPCRGSSVSCSGLNLCLVSSPISLSDLRPAFNFTFTGVINTPPTPGSQEKHFPTAYFPTVFPPLPRSCLVDHLHAGGKDGRRNSAEGRVKEGPTRRCKVDRWASGMKRTGGVMWSSRVLK